VEAALALVSAEPSNQLAYCDRANRNSAWRSKITQQPYVRAQVQRRVRDAAAIRRRNGPANSVFCAFEERRHISLQVHVQDRLYALRGRVDPKTLSVWVP